MVGLAAEKQHYRLIKNMAFAYALFLKDDVLSLMWLNLIKDTEQYSGDTVVQNIFLQLRNRMKVQQIDKAQKLARECVLKDTKDAL